MSNSTTLIDQLSSTQAQKEVVANANFDAASPIMIWGRHASACVGLTWGYYGGYYNGNAIANGTVTLTASATNYLFADPITGAVSQNTTGVPAGKVALYSIVVGTSTVTSYTDLRSYAPSATAAPAGTVPYDVTMFFPGAQTSASQLFARIKFNRTVTFPSTSGGTPIACDAGTAATGSTTFTIAKNGSSIGTLVWAASGTTPTITFNTATTFNAGDVLTVTGPSVADATLGNVSLTMSGTR